MEIITGVERCRRWRVEEKLRIVAEIEQPGGSVAAVARRHDLSRGQLWNWRSEVRRGVLVAEPEPVFMPVRIATGLASQAQVPVSKPGASGSETASSASPTRIEIALPDGTCIRVGTDVGLVALRRVIAAVRR